MTRILTFFLCAFAISFSVNAQQSEPDRIALVIGVQNYTAVQPLRHSLNDANDMALTLRDKGFKVDLLLDPKSGKEIKDAISRYFNLISKGSVGVLYYSGHAIVFQGSNYLIPATAQLQTPADVNDQCVRMDYVIDNLSHSENLNILILDACRTNTFPSFSRDIAGGLANVEPPKGSIILFATQPGKTASDGTGRNGLFTSKLLKYMDEPRLNILDVLKKVKQDVLTESDGQQLPSYVDNSLGGDFYFTKDEKSVSRTKTAANAQEDLQALTKGSTAKAQSYESPTQNSLTDDRLTIQKIVVDDKSTTIYFQFLSTEATGIRLGAPKTPGAFYIKADGKEYKLVATNGIGTTFGNVTANKPSNFSATFEPLPPSVKRFDLLEGTTGSWHFFGVQLDPTATEPAKPTAFDFGTTNDYGYGANDAPTVKIGTQEWTAKNISIDHFANGDPIPQARTMEEWDQAGEEKTPAWCYYNFDPANGPKYGKLYNWFAIDDLRGLAPQGWHIPSDEEWTKLTAYLGGRLVAGSFMKDSNGWRNSGSASHKGNNRSGLTALPGGWIDGFAESFQDLGKFGKWWSSTEATLTIAGVGRRLQFDSREVVMEWAAAKRDGLSVRLVKDGD